MDTVSLAEARRTKRLKEEKVEEKLVAMVDDLFENIRDEIGRSLSWQECRVLNDRIIEQVIRHREEYGGM